jgi:MgtE intracellular N domain
MFQDAVFCASPQLLSLGGNNEQQTHMAGALGELDARNAYTIMSYMTPQEKAALLASMDAASVARLLALMPPQEAVVLLAALGGGDQRLVSECLSSEERAALMQVLSAAGEPDATSRRPAKGGKGKRRPAVNGAAGGKARGSDREASDATVSRLAGAYEVTAGFRFSGTVPPGDGDAMPIERGTIEIGTTARDSTVSSCSIVPQLVKPATPVATLITHLVFIRLRHSSRPCRRSPTAPWMWKKRRKNRCSSWKV